MHFDDVTGPTAIDTTDRVLRTLTDRLTRVLVAGRAPPSIVDSPEIRRWMHERALQRQSVVRAWWDHDQLYVERRPMVLSSADPDKLSRALTQVQLIEADDPKSDA
jgi:hypothetical protein